MVEYLVEKPFTQKNIFSELVDTSGYYMKEGYSNYTEHFSWCNNIFYIC